ncbi:MAG TPA: hypothetical protein VNA69_00530 [Thermoanaerobaculia bacterium]|nr:hypothetical protein [Thermoanaerobaculia bacterium]
MPRKSMNRMQQKSALRRAASAVQRLFARGQEEEWTLEAAPQTQPTAQHQEPKAANPVQRRTDIPLDVLDRAYIPPLTSSKASFRSDGGDHQRDQDVELGLTGERWNDEDRYTNKSGDPRIGTHGRTNEPAETRAEKGD